MNNRKLSLTILLLIPGCSLFDKDGGGGGNDSGWSNYDSGWWDSGGGWEGEGFVPWGM